MPSRRWTTASWRDEPSLCPDTAPAAPRRVLVEAASRAACAQQRTERFTAARRQGAAGMGTPRSAVGPGRGPGCAPAAASNPRAIGLIHELRDESPRVWVSKEGICRHELKHLSALGSARMEL